MLFGMKCLSLILADVLCAPISLGYEARCNYEWSKRRGDSSTLSKCSSGSHLNNHTYVCSDIGHLELRWGTWNERLFKQSFFTMLGKLFSSSLRNKF